MVLGEEASQNDEFSWMVRGGHAGDLIRHYTWASTSIGRPSQWPQDLRSALNSTLSSAIPQMLLWGSDSLCFPNDAFARLFPDEKVSLAGSYDLSSDCQASKLAHELVITGRGETFITPKGRFALTPIFSSQSRQLKVDGVNISVIGGTETADLPLPNAEDAILNTEERLKLMFAHSLTHLTIVSSTGKFMKVNDAFLRYTGFSADDVIGKSFMEFSHPDDTAITLEHMEKLYYRDALSVSFEKRYLKKDGSYGWVQASVSPIFGDSGEFLYVVSVSQDITARKETERELLAAREEAERANASKSALLANVSHEFRTPLGIIRGFTDMLLESRERQSDFADASVTEREWLETISRNATDLTKLVDDILDLAKAEADHFQLESVAFNLQRLIDDLDAEFRLKASKKGIRFDVISGIDVNQVVSTDPTRLRQILLNVIGNAIKFTHHGSVELKVFRCPESPKMIRFDVRDTGIGLTAEQAERLFEPFVQADTSTTREFGGTGLGLALSRKLAKALGGDLKIAESQTDVGSCFSLTIEAAIASPAPDSKVDLKAGSLEQKPSVTLSGLKILVVDDSKDNRILISRLLTRAGAEIEEAFDGIDALDKLKVLSVDLVVMDLQMPRMDGYRTCETLRGLSRVTPILALTANAMKGEREKCLASGFNDYLSKPVNAGDLIARVAALTNRGIIP